jgi:hypothetical protein
VSGQTGTVQVSAAALLLAYCHGHTLELLAAGVDQLRADYAGYVMFDQVLVPATVGGLRLFPDPPGTIITDDMRFVPVKCLAHSCATVREALRMDWEQVQAVAARSFDLAYAGGTPAAWMHPDPDQDQLGRLGWLEETLRRVAEGGELLTSARGAHDAHLGKPRRKRRPVERDWLAAQIAAALDDAWYALRYARLGEGAGQTWIRPDLIPSEVRPAGFPARRPIFDPAIFERR